MRAATAALILSLLLVVAGCGGDTGGASANNNGSGTQPAQTTAANQEGTTVQAVTPEEVLSKKERTGAPDVKGWNDPAAKGYKPATAEFFVGAGSSTGAIPAVKPFNFGRDPGGPEDKTLYLDVPELGLDDVAVYDSVSEEKLRDSTVHVPATGFPWQEGANTYIAGHRIGYPDTGSYHIFYELDELSEGDEITLRDSAGQEYDYRVTSKKVVGPGNTEVMNPVEGKSIVTLQTCTLPDYSERIVVQGELVGES